MTARVASAPRAKAARTARGPSSLSRAAGPGERQGQSDRPGDREAGDQVAHVGHVTDLARLERRRPVRQARVPQQLHAVAERPDRADADRRQLAALLAVEAI
ncbi:MAG: hypothetical protein WEB79_09190 [Thermoleophilaceae bacterium]